MNGVICLDQPLTLVVRNQSLVNEGLKIGDCVQCWQYHFESNQVWIEDHEAKCKNKRKPLPLSCFQYLDNHPQSAIFREQLVRWHIDDAKALLIQDPLIGVNILSSYVESPVVLLTYRQLSEEDQTNLPQHLTWLRDHGVNFNSYSLWRDLFGTLGPTHSIFYEEVWRLGDHFESMTDDQLDLLLNQCLGGNPFGLAFLIAHQVNFDVEKMTTFHAEYPRLYDANYRECLFDTDGISLPLLHDTVAKLSGFIDFNAVAKQHVQIFLEYLFEHLDWKAEDGHGHTVLDIARIKNHPDILPFCLALKSLSEKETLSLQTPALKSVRARRF